MRITVPDSSVLRDDNNQPFVYLAIGANQFGRRDVEIGQSLEWADANSTGHFPWREGCGRWQLVSSVC